MDNEDKVKIWKVPVGAESPIVDTMSPDDFALYIDGSSRRGYITLIPIIRDDDRSLVITMVVNEEGYLKDLPPNHLASKICPNIVGNAIITCYNDQTGEEKDLPFTDEELKDSRFFDALYTGPTVRSR